ncbi:hypothetical protein JQN58_18745 [Aneurinibacillus sp. BA2021]|nr:hypothetical protein [Aneurinibacillus sp. BA2021]
MKKKTRRYTYKVIWLAAFALMLSGCGSKDNLPTEQELSAKIAQKQEQKQEQQLADAKQTLDRYFNAIAADVKELGDTRTAFFQSFAELSNRKITQSQAQSRIAAAIADYEKALKKLHSLQPPPYPEAEQFHQDVYRTMDAYIPAMKKAEQGLRKQNANALEDAEKQMTALDAKAKKTLEQASHLQIKINPNG